MEGIVQMKRKGVAVALVVMCALAGCGTDNGKEVEAAREERVYPEEKDVVACLEEAGFEVEQTEDFEELDLAVSRVRAVKDGEYLDLCYDVASEDDSDKIVEYYTQSYQKYNLVIDDETVYCYSSESVLQSAGLN